MRSGACTVQQTLTVEAASVLKHSLGLARRRGHAQVTPLHVAATLLSARSSLLRRACLKSQPHHASHPLQCRALELCFNVALNRLPTNPVPLLHEQPTLSNALIAALKRAQAHQRRGCVEQQQQPLLTVKVELEQLVISILDDPSVSRVMREAGFSSTSVKNNMEDSATSGVFQCYTSFGGVYSSPCSPSPTEMQKEIIEPATFWQTHFSTSSSNQQSRVLFSQPKIVPRSCFADSASHVNDDIKVVLEVFSRKKRKNTVIVGDCLPITECLIGELMGRIERGEVPAELKQARFIKFQLAPVSLRFMKKHDVDMNLSELKMTIDSLGEGGAIIYTGDLKWTVEETVFNGDTSGYSAADHLIKELGRLLSDYSTSNTKVWLMATASYQTYMRCQTRKPPLEIQWALQVVSVPSGGLDLSLQASSTCDPSITFSQNPSQVLETKPLINEEQDKLSCCGDCFSNYEKEAKLLKSDLVKHWPSWLQQRGRETQQKDELDALKRKWNRLCCSLHNQGRHAQGCPGSTFYGNQQLTEKTSAYASSYPWWQSQCSNFPNSNSISFVDSSWKSKQSSSYVPKFRRQLSCSGEFNFGNDTRKHHPTEPSLDSLKNIEDQEVKITLALGNAFCSGLGKVEKGLSDVLLKLLQDNVPWQSEVIPAVVEVLSLSKSTGGVTWLLIEGNDAIGKRRLALAIAESVLGSPDLLLRMNTRKSESQPVQHSEMLEKALRNQEKLVVLVEDVDLADAKFLKFLSDRIENGNFAGTERSERKHDQAVVILTSGGVSMIYEDHGKKNPDSVIQMILKVTERQTASCGTNNMDHKRKSDEEISSRSKSLRIKEKDDTSWVPLVTRSKQESSSSRQSSFNSLDLNIKANEETEGEETHGELSPISSELTMETTSHPVSPRAFLDLIKNRFVFDGDHQARDRHMAEVFFSKTKTCIQEVFGDPNEIGFSIEDRVLEAIGHGLGYTVNGLFKRWLKDIFQTSLQTVKYGGKGGIDFMICFGGNSDEVSKEGFMATCLPSKIPVSIMN